MPVVPRILRLIPKEPIYRPGEPIPVTARLQFRHLGMVREVPALATAWTRVPRPAVEIAWTFEGQERADWIPAADVRHREPAAPS
jgi:hypothetical protein